VLAAATGLVDAGSYLGVGHVFVANMTGDVVLLGFALSGAAGLSIVASLVSLAGFLVRAVASGAAGGPSRRAGAGDCGCAPAPRPRRCWWVPLAGALVGGALTLHAGLPTALAVTAVVFALVAVGFAVVVPDTDR
jgi:uncharacterized membrane protein YoaK (UPF0700 family)